MVDTHYYVYILTNKMHTVFYTGVTNNLLVRTIQHREKMIDGFTKRYNISKLVYYEETQDVRSAIEREKQIKDYRREKKLHLINTMNPELNDLFDSLQ